MKGTCEKTRLIQRLKIGYRQRSFSVLIAAWAGLLWLLPGSSLLRAQPVLVDHTCTNIKLIPESAILAAKLNLHIAYGHTSHGSQLTDGMTALVGFMNGLGYPNNLYAWNDGGTGGALDLHDYAMDGDVGYYPDWVNNTHSYLGAVNSTTGRGSTNPDVNVIVWSWCGQAAGYTAQNMIDYYLTPMNALESEYWGMKFVYMTCHLDGSGVDGNLNQRNNQIRQYCQNNNKILYDFADIESYDPDGLVNYMPLGANDNCDYDSDGNGSTESNWAIAWQNSHTLNVDWFECSAAHTQPLNGNRKAYAAWWLWARLAGWDSGSATLTLTSPNGGESWAVGSSQNITWTSTGTVGNVDIIYSYNGGGNWTSIVADTANDGSYSWTVPSTPSINCLVRVRDSVDNDPSDSSDAVFTITTSAEETVSAPNTPSGPSSGTNIVDYAFSTGGAASSLGHAVQYRFDWDDGSDSGWLVEGITQYSHDWSAAGTYHVRAMARCAEHNGIESLWSGSQTIIIYEDSASGAYNSPAQYKVLPEVIWSSATGGGTWMSNVQVTDVSGGSQVSVYYNTASGRRGPFLLWDNSAGGALSSVKYANLLETIDGLDTETFTYYGTVGAVEFISQDGSHLLQAAARTLNGNYAKTFTALSLHDNNTATYIRSMIIPNLTNNSDYRSTCGFFNPCSNEPVTVEMKLFNANDVQVGNTISRTLAEYGFTVINPFTEAGVPYPGTTSDNFVLEVMPNAATGAKVMCFGASANNTSNDPAAHVAVQKWGNYDNGPGSLQILPEAIWAPATGGGTWMTEVQMVDVTGSSIVSVYFYYGGGLRRGPFVLWTGSGASTKVKYGNLLQTIDGLDTGEFNYYGKIGAVVFQTQDEWDTNIQVTARTLNGNYSKTFPGLNLVEAETADTSRVMLIQNYTNNSSYRSTCGFFNPTADAVTVEFTLLNSSGVQIGTPFSKTLAGHDFQAFNPFIQAGVPYPGNSYDNVILRVRPTTGAGSVMCFGATVDNTSNDPAAHIAVQKE